MPIYKMDSKKNGWQKYRVRINYVDNEGKAKQIDRVVYGYPEAKALEAKLLEQVKNPQIKPKITLKQLYDEYMENKKHEVRETSLDKSKRNLERYVLPYFEDVKIDKLTNARLQEWKNEISEFDSKLGRKLSIITKQNIFGEFRALLNYAVKMDIIPKNPLTNIGTFKDAYETNLKEKLHYYTANEFKKYISCAKQNCNTLNDWGYYVFFNIAFFTGLRKGEIHALKWSDIEGNVLHVRRSIAQKLKGGDRETPPKNKSSYRSLQMPNPLIKILDEHKKRQKQLEGFTENWRVCGGINCLRDSSLDKKNKSFADAAGLPHIRIHDFRHSHATLLANEGINIQEIARRLGHSKIEITWNTYAHLYPREEEKAVKILNQIK